MYTAHTNALPFIDNRLRNQVPTRASTIAYTSNQLRSSWGPGPNHTPKMQRGLSLQWKGLGRGTLPLQALNCKTSLLPKLILTLVTFSYLSNAFFTASMSIRWDTKNVISSAYAETFALTRPAKGTPRRAGLALSSLSLRSRGSKTRT